MTDNYVLPNGQTFLASTCGYQGSWAKAQDPMTAVEKAANDVSSDGGKVPVKVFLITEGKSWIGELGGINWENGYTPIPIGLWKVETGEYHGGVINDEWVDYLPAKVTLMQDNDTDFNGKNDGHEKWMERWLTQLTEKAA